MPEDEIRHMPLKKYLCRFQGRVFVEVEAITAKAAALLAFERSDIDVSAIDNKALECEVYEVPKPVRVSISTRWVVDCETL